MTAHWPAIVIIQWIDAGSPSNQCVAIIPHASQGTCTVSGIELKGAQVQCVGGIWLRSTQQCTMNVNGCILGKWKCPGCICMSSIRMLNRMMASSALLQNGQLDRAGTARRSGPVGFGSAQQPRRMIKVRRLSGGRLSTHRGTRQGMSTSHKKGAMQGGSEEHILTPMINVGFCGCSEIRTRTVSTKENHPKMTSTQKEKETVVGRAL